MGFRLTTLQISGKDRDTVCVLLGLRRSGNIDPTSFEAVSGRRQPDGAYLIVGMDDMGRLAKPEVLRSLSGDAELLVCQIHEGCMWSRAGGWRDGEQIWSVEHVGDGGRNHLDVFGTPPPPFKSIRQAREAQQAAEAQSPFGIDHIFDIAPALYAALTGFRYDRLDPAAIFEALLPAESHKAALQKRDLPGS